MVEVWRCKECGRIDNHKFGIHKLHPRKDDYCEGEVELIKDEEKVKIPLDFKVVDQINPSDLKECIIIYENSWGKRIQIPLRKI